MDIGQRTLEFGIALGERGLHVRARRYRRRGVRHDQAIVRARIGKKQHGKIQASLLSVELRIRKVALALLLLKLRLHNIGVRYLTAGLALLGERRKSCSLVESALRNYHATVPNRGGVKETRHAGNQTSPGDFKFSGRDRERRGGTAYRIELLSADSLVDLPLADVLMDRIVGDESRSGIDGAAGAHGRSYAGV